MPPSLFGAFYFFLIVAVTSSSQVGFTKHQDSCLLFLEIISDSGIIVTSKRLGKNKKNLSPHILFVNEGYSDKNKERQEQLPNQGLLLCTSANINLKAERCSERFSPDVTAGGFFTFVQKYNALIGESWKAEKSNFRQEMFLLKNILNSALSGSA